MSLHEIEKEYGEKIGVEWKAFPLRPEPEERYWNDHAAESWAEAEATGSGAHFVPWKPDVPMPATSIPALVAAKCAELQGKDAFARYHLAVLKAYFEEGRDIADWNVLVQIAAECGLDLESFIAALQSGEQAKKVVADYQEAFERRITNIPLVVVSDGQNSYGVRGGKLVDGKPLTDQYRRLVEFLLASAE
ncbi:MAG: DsbA family protein [Chloroflexi bacterium]|nr:DsbA family protein [Chloroflexota bacterium]